MPQGTGELAGRQGRGGRAPERPAPRGPARSDRASDLPLGPCEDRARRDEAAYGATIEGRFSQRETSDHLGLHGVTISGIVRARELGKRPEGKTASKRR